jgi:DNA-directed RNA polymerase specialized sigma24 family protein
MWRIDPTDPDAPGLTSVPESPDDSADLSQVLRRVARGDQHAFELVHDQLARPAYGVIRRVLRDPAQSEEVTQEVLLEVWRTASRFEPAMGSAATWVLTIAHRRAIDRVRAETAAAGREQKTAWAGSPPRDEVAEAVEASLDRERFIQHLRRCHSCTGEVRGLREVATALAFAAAAEPPPELRERVLAAVSQTRQLPPEAAPQRRFRVSPVRIPWRIWLPRLATATAVLAIVAVVVLGIALSSTRQQLNSERTQSRAIAAVLAAPDVRTVTGPVHGGGRATVVMSAAKRELVVSTIGLAPLPPGRVYELWLIRPAAIRRAGLVPVAVSGPTAPVLAAGLVAGDKLGMTVEPAGGTNQPTTTPILLLSLPAGM